MVSFRIKYVIEKRSGGKIIRYWQPKAIYNVEGKWMKCPLSTVRLPDDESWVQRAHELNAALKEWRTKRTKPLAPQGTVDWLIHQYTKDNRFTALAPNTRKFYEYGMKKVSSIFGDIPYTAITRVMAAKFYQSVGTKGRKGAIFMQVARIVFSFARDMDLITSNPFSEQRIKKHRPRDMVVSREDIERAKTTAVNMGLESISQAIQIAFDSGQRASDIRTMQRNQYDGKWLTITQSKTGSTVNIPVYKMPDLKKMLDSIKPDSTLFLLEERTGKPYTKDMLCRRVREVFKAAGIGSDIQFRDFRRTSVVRLAEASCKVQEICAITGHSLKEATNILETYMPRTRKMSENAMDKVQKLEKRQNTGAQKLEKKI